MQMDPSGTLYSSLLYQDFRWISCCSQTFITFTLNISSREFRICINTELKFFKRKEKENQYFLICVNTNANIYYGSY
jgi:hypothetical protein